MYAGICLKNAHTQKIAFTILSQNLEIKHCTENHIRDLVHILAPYKQISAGIDLPAPRGRPSKIDQQVITKPANFNLPSESILQSTLQAAGFSSQPANPRNYLVCRSVNVFQSLLKSTPFPARSLEGRLQRQLVLFDYGVQVSDPFAFFEEITRHHLLSSDLPLETIHSSHELNALAAALYAYKVAHPG